MTFGRVLVAHLDGLRIQIHPREHAPPHFHVVADGINARFAIETGKYLGLARRHSPGWGLDLTSCCSVPARPA